MAVGDEPLSLLSNLLARHWLCDFRNNRHVRRKRLSRRRRRHVTQTDSANGDTDIAGVFNTTSAIFRGSRLLNAY
jgi:hypothetical protein